MLKNKVAKFFIICILITFLVGCENKINTPKPIEEEKTFADKICGSYTYEEKEDEEDYTYLIKLFRIDDILMLQVDRCFEYDVMDYWAGEITPIGDIDSTSITECDVTIREFSSFSMAGEYWDEARPCTISLKDNGIMFSGEAQPFIKDGQPVVLVRDEGNINDIGENAKYNLLQAGYETKEEDYKNKELLGKWYMQDDKYKIFVEFCDDGVVYYSRKEVDRPIEVYIGGYVFESKDGKEITILATRSGYAGMPYYNTASWSIDNGELVLKDVDEYGMVSFNLPNGDALRLKRK